jgi:hypothetical protein
MMEENSKTNTSNDKDENDPFASIDNIPKGHRGRGIRANIKSNNRKEESQAEQYNYNIK